MGVGIGVEQGPSENTYNVGRNWLSLRGGVEKSWRSHRVWQ